MHWPELKQRHNVTFCPSFIISVTQLVLPLVLDFPFPLEFAVGQIFLPEPLDGPFWGDTIVLRTAGRGCRRASMLLRIWEISWMASSKVQPLAYKSPILVHSCWSAWTVRCRHRTWLQQVGKICGYTAPEFQSELPCKERLRSLANLTIAANGQIQFE